MDTYYNGDTSPLVSIIMPVFNSEKTVQFSIESVLRQDYPNWELIIIDDGSSDSSGIICDKMSTQDRRIRVYHLINSGVSAARNYGLSRAQGKLICFIDSDDKMRSNALNVIVESVSDTDLLIYGYNIYPSNIKQGFSKTEKYSSIIQFADDFKRIHQYHLMNCVWNKCFKKSIVDQCQCRFPVEISMGEDLLFILSYFEGCKKIKIINSILYDYNTGISGSLSKKYSVASFATQKLLKDTTDKTFNRHSEVMAITSYIFVNHIIEEMKKIALDDEVNQTIKFKIIKEWMKNPYFRNNFHRVKASIPQGNIIKFIISNNKALWFYDYLLFIKIGSKVKQKLMQTKNKLLHWKTN